LEAAIREESGIEQFTIAYSKPTTIGSVIAKAQLHQEEGYEVSKYSLKFPHLSVVCGVLVCCGVACGNVELVWW
jgi:hypothetical protein